MILSNSSKYALKAVLYLTLYTDDNRKMQVKEISENIEVPKAYTAKLLQALSRNDIISSARGPKGGFYVSNENRQNSLMSIVDVIDGRKKIDTCILGLSECNQDKPCPLHNLITHSRSLLLHVLETKTIGELANDLKDKKTFLPN